MSSFVLGQVKSDLADMKKKDTEIRGKMADLTRQQREIQTKQQELAADLVGNERSIEYATSLITKIEKQMATPTPRSDSYQDQQ